MRRVAPLLALLAVACGHEKAQEPATAAATPAAAAGDTLEKTTDAGPVKATVSLSPKKPRLGDRLTLTLTVDAAAGVDVTMPAFGDALGRFGIVEFVPGAPHPVAGGGTRTVQRYTLESPLSGRYRIPALRIEFTLPRSPTASPKDQRPGFPKVTDERSGHAADAGAAAVHELLTEEIPLQVASVLGAGKANAELRAPRGPLPETPARGLAGRLWPLALAVPALVAALLLWRAARRRAARRARIGAFDAAMGRLARLEGRGFPGPEEADGWYVELSGIVRRYIEDRFAIRAPELTTEEFLHVARRSPELGDEHAGVLSRFLAGCDRVKFAGYHPDDKESAGALGAARRFLEETRLEEQPPARRAA